MAKTVTKKLTKLAGGKKKAPVKDKKTAPRKSTVKKVTVVKSKTADDVKVTQTTKVTKVAKPTKVTKKAADKVATLVAKVTKKSTEQKPKKVRKPTNSELSGIGIGPARVKSVLIKSALNARENNAIKAVLVAANRPSLLKTSAGVKDQKEQVPLAELDHSVLVVVEEAELAYANALRSSYETSVLKKLDADARKTYTTERKKAQSAHQAEQSKLPVEERKDFDVRAFNTKYQSTFYDGLDAYVSENDNYSLAKGKYDEWGRAVALMHKLCTRLSSNTRNIMAAFLDRLVEQYTHNGIHNCLLESRRIVKLRHAITESDDFPARVPLSNWVRTFEAYADGSKWVSDSYQKLVDFKAARAEGKQAELTKPVYPEGNYDYDFSNYVGEIFRTVRAEMASSAKTDEDKAKCLNVTISSDFKKFCSHMICNAIMRIGHCLRDSVDRCRMKTISDSLVWHTIRQVHNMCGMPYEHLEEKMVASLKKFVVWRQQRKDKRRDERKKTEKAEQNDEVAEEPEESDGESNHEEENEFEYEE